MSQAADVATTATTTPGEVAAAIAAEQVEYLSRAGWTRADYAGVWVWQSPCRTLTRQGREAAVQLQRAWDRERAAKPPTPLGERGEPLAAEGRA